MARGNRGRRGAAANGEQSVLSELDPNTQPDTNFGDEEDEDEDYPGVATKPTKKHFRHRTDEDEEGYLSPLACSDSDEEANDRQSVTLDGAMERSKQPKDKGTGKSPKPKLKQRRRRRSSARFLRLSGRFGPDGEDDDIDAGTKNNENLGEVYRQAIQMNAENKINAGNSWGLRLIENMDKFTYDDEGGNPREPAKIDEPNGNEKRVNFTKASCTLDASVKIYGYRVDDVHLTSYKVLANLNRTDNGGGNKKSNQNGPETDGNEDGVRSAGKKSSVRTVPTETLESNLANINMSKLESAPDIDPLFRKMSKAFDEGGAKGLLLNNLNVASDGCRIEFDSKDDSVAEGSSAKLSDAFSQGEECADKENDDQGDTSGPGKRQEGEIDISCLGNVLSGLLSGSTMESLQLVPQLKTLRADFAALEAEGFVNKNVPKTKSKRYGVTEEEEKEAEQCIHREALERSQRSVMNVSFAASVGGADYDDDVDDGYGPNDFGGGDDDFDDGNANSFGDFNAMDSSGARYSSTGSQNSNPSESFTRSSMKGRTSTTMLLDALCSSDAFANGGEYEYFSQATLEKVSTGNLWAGSAHWKKSEKIRRKRATQNAGIQKEKKKKSSKERAFVDLSASSHPCLDALLGKSVPKKGRSDPLQLTQAAQKKQKNQDNLLPPDAGIGVEQLSRLFMRPNASLHPSDQDPQNSRKSVGFHDVEYNIAFDDGADDSFGDDGDDGQGFNFAADEEGNFGDNDDFVVEEIEGVRKVEKIEIGYATVAKKVDVRRLKKDLWAEVEAKTAPAPVETSTMGDTAVAENLGRIGEKKKTHQVSFKKTVQQLESSQSQSEVTVPFYFICILHLANEKGLKLDSNGLVDFIISRDDGSAPTFGTLPDATENTTEMLAVQRVRRNKKAASYNEEAESSCDEDEDFEE